MLVFARKPAPVQLTMLGLPSTTGLDSIDYRLTDPWFDPPGSGDDDYSEQSIRLPRTCWCYQPPEDAPAAAPLPSLKTGFITFGCLNQFAKASPAALQCWVRILQAVPASRLVLHAPLGSHRDLVRALFAAAGVAAERVAFDGKVPLRDYLVRYRDFDLCLDPWPYSGGVTTMDALWMGVPVITLAGRTGVGRSGVSILSNVGLAELIAQTPEQYVARAVALAGDRDRLAELRGGLRHRMQTSPLLDGPQYAADVEAAFRLAWRSWCCP
jgi:predicted O-linked N-acetylglucosamine transferase (SPINDLY family)